MASKLPRMETGLAVPLIIVTTVMLVALVASVTVHRVILNNDYYKQTIDDSNAIDRAYSELAVDEALGPEVTDLLGGVDILGLDIPTAVEDVVPRDSLDGVVSLAIDEFIEFLKSNQRLNLTLDVTEFIGAIDVGAVGIATAALDDIPTKQSPNYETFVRELTAAVDGIHESGKLPPTLPTFDIPRNRKAEVTRIIVERSGLNGQGIQGTIQELAVQAAVEANDIPGAIKAALGPMLADVSGGSVASLVGGKYIREEEGKDGEVRYLLGPPKPVEEDIEQSLSDFQTTVALTDWLRFIAGGGLVLGLLGLALGGAPSLGTALMRAGMPLLAGGAIGVVGWFAGKPTMKSIVVDAAIGDAKGSLPGSFEKLVEDVLGTGVENLQPAVLLPFGAALVLGLVLVAAGAVTRGRAA